MIIKSPSLSLSLINSLIAMINKFEPEKKIPENPENQRKERRRRRRRRERERKKYLKKR